jgi:hypothetical protein
MGNEEVGQIIDGIATYTIIGCWDKQTPENEYDFFDVYDNNGTCINEGEPLYERPYTVADLEGLI